MRGRVTKPIDWFAAVQRTHAQLDGVGVARTEGERALRVDERLARALGMFQRRIDELRADLDEAVARAERVEHSILRRIEGRIGELENRLAQVAHERDVALGYAAARSGRGVQQALRDAKGGHDADPKFPEPRR